MAGGGPLPAIALSAAGAVLAGIAALMLSSGRADLRVALLLGAVGLAAAAALPFAWVATFGRGP